MIAAMVGGGDCVSVFRRIRAAKNRQSTSLENKRVTAIAFDDSSANLLDNFPSIKVD